MSSVLAASTLFDLRPNLDWASLPLFDRTGWTRLPFGAFAESIGERAEPKDAQEEIYVGLEHLDPQCLHIRRWGKGSDVIGGKLRFRKGDIIFGKRRAYQRKVAVAEFSGICSAHALVVRARPDKVLPEFLPFLMMSDRFMNRAVEISVGSLSPTINWTTLKLEEFDLPPLDQQRRIADIFWAVEGSLRKWTTAHSAANDAFRSKVETYLMQGDERISSFQQTRIGKIPSAWKAVQLGEATEECRERNQNLELERSSVLSVSNQVGFIRSDERIPSDVDLSRYKIVRRDEFGYNPMRLNVGSIARLESPMPGLVSPDYVVFRCVTQSMLAEYFDVLRTTHFWKRQINSAGQGSIRTRYYYKDIASFIIPLPSLAEQKRILHEIQAQKAVTQQAAEHLADTRSLVLAFINQFTATMP
jgi:restriction endonuclease S subunit